MSNSFKHLSVDERNDIQAGLNVIPHADPRFTARYR